MATDLHHDHRPLWRGPGLPPICTCAAHFGQVLRPHPVPVKSVSR